VLLDKGTDVWEFLYNPADIDFMWHTPQGLPRREFLFPSSALPGGFFVDFYEGGWQEILPSGGRASPYHGTQYGFHGELWNLSWDHVIEKDEPSEVAALCRCRTRRAPFLIEKRFRLVGGHPILYIEERLTNESEQPLEYMWGHHPAFGAPFLSQDCRLDVPAKRVAVHSFPDDPDKRFEGGAVYDWPTIKTVSGEIVDASRFPPASVRSSDELCLLDLVEGWYAITDTNRKVGFALAWDLQMFPYLWFWQVFGGGRDFPWYGRTYNCALEPWSSYPLFGIQNAIKEGTHKTLGPRESVTTWLVAVAYSGLEKVERVSRDGAVSG